MGKKHAKCNGKGDFGSGSCTGASASPVGSPPPLPPLHHSRTNSTRPSPSVPGTPLSSSFTFDYDSDFPPVSQLNSPPDSEYRSRRSSSFTGSESTARLAEIEGVDIEQELRGRLVDIHRKNKPPKNPGVLDKDYTEKLLKFWRSIFGHEDEGALPTIAEDPTAQDDSTKLVGFPYPSEEMDHSHLAPGSFDGPKRDRQIQDARDMYQTVVRNAERAHTDVPPYDFLELIGKGGYGRVYKCRKRANGDLVAVKIISIDDADFQEHVLDKDNTISAFQKEVAILQQLKDSKAKNINMIHEAFDMHNQLWIVSDYCTGGSLRTLMRANPKRGFEEHFIIPIARELAVAIKSVHDIGVIHRDIKCANVYVDEEGRIQLGDFGIVGVIDDGSSKRRTIVGTPHYLPLEMHASRSHLTDEAYGTEIDIWSYGITVFEMATGLPPYTAVPPDRLAEATVNAPRLEGGDYSSGLRDFVAFCLNGDPKERPSAAEVLRHPYIANTEHKYPTSGLVKLIERYAVWEYGGGQRQSLFFAGGAAAPVVPPETQPEIEDDDIDWNFSTSESFNADFGRRYSQMMAAQTLGSPQHEARAGSGLPPIVTRDLSRYEQLQQDIQDLSASRGGKSLDRLFNQDTTPYELHTPIDNDEPLSDLPLRNIASMGETRESMIDLDDAADLDLNPPNFNFDFGDIPTLRARTSRPMSRSQPVEEGNDYPTDTKDERRVTMEWTFPQAQAEEKKRTTMDWTFSTAQHVESDEPEASMSLPPVGTEGLAPGFRPALKHTTTEPLGQFGDHIHGGEVAGPRSGSPVRDSIQSMLDLDLADPGDILRPSTATSATGSTMTDMTSGNPFDLEDNTEQVESDRNRFSYHKQWQSEGGQMKRRSHKHMQMHSRGSSLTDTDSEHDAPRADDVYDYEYSRQMSESLLAQMKLNIPEHENGLNHWPNFGQDSGLDEEPRYQDSYIPRIGDPDFPLHQTRHTNGVSGHAYAQSGSQDNGHAAQHEIEFPELVAPHSDALKENADPRVMISELDRLLEDFGDSLKATSRALRRHTGANLDEVASETDGGFDSSTVPTGDEDCF